MEDGRGHGEEEALRLIEASLAHFELSHSDWEELLKGDARKLAIAQVVRERTTVSNRWLVRMLQLGHESRVSRACGNEDLLGKLARCVFSSGSQS